MSPGVEASSLRLRLVLKAVDFLFDVLQHERAVGDTLCSLGEREHRRGKEITAPYERPGSSANLTGQTSKSVAEV